MRYLFLLSVALLAAAPAVAADRPNFVFVLIDDLRHNGLGCTGHPFVKTPHIDRLAKEGATFTNAFVAVPLCSPARATFLTGRYAHATGVVGNGDNAAISHRLVTFPRLLHAAGYATAYVGKWHMGNDDSPRPGFDRWVSFRGQGVFTDPPLNIDGKPVKATGYMTDILSQHAVEFVKAQKPDKPFCLYLAHKAVHSPFTPADRHKDLYADDTYTPPANVVDDLSGKPAMTANRDKEKPKAKQPGGPGGRFGTMRNQMRCMNSIDEGIGQLLKSLEETKQLDNTVVVFTSDNGYFWGEHSGLGDKRWAYEESIRIPFLVRYPKLAKPGTKVSQMVVSVDVAPTFLELAGVMVPTNIHGKSVVPLLRGDAAGWRSAILTEYFLEKNFPRTPTWQAVRTDRWKYVRYPGHPEWDEVYDLAADPGELKNLIREDAGKAALKELTPQLERLLKETGT